ncbi:YesL family protein [Paenibacillaceae bacterium WGS1546]|uniref:YesL family protein n=1 Tax=Cohnella sp. WGS1546 TaxID=3366810 RepID=UPI00372D651B
MEMRGMMGGFYKLSEWIMRLSVTNVLWLLTSIPFWFLVLMFLMAQDTAQLQAVVIPLAIVAPFTLFPATSAMFSVARKWVLGDVDVPLFKTFFRNYKQNYVQAMLGGIIYAVLFAILIIDFQVYLRQMPGFEILAYLFIALMLLLLISLLHFFSLLSHFHMKTVQLLKNALILTIGRPFRSLLMAVGAVAVIAISMRFTFLLPFFFGSIIAVYTFYNFNMVIQKMMLLKEAAEAQAEADAENDDDADGKAESSGGNKIQS